MLVYTFVKEGLLNRKDLFWLKIFSCFMLPQIFNQTFTSDYQNIIQLHPCIHASFKTFMVNGMVIIKKLNPCYFKPFYPAIFLLINILLDLLFISIRKKNIFCTKFGYFFH
ncbi:hypothetical protein ACJX0J_031686 [Zea mays]